MELKLLRPRIALNKSYLKTKTSRSSIDLFKRNLTSVLDTIDEFESEEFHKNLISDFLKNTWYGASHFINTKDRKDLVIHNGNTAGSPVGVIIEAKKPTNKAEMLRQDNINTKAFQELVLYYLRERITHKNTELKHLIATNIYEWYIFDAQLFEKVFAQNKPLVKKFTDFEEGRAGGNKTDFFYTEIAAPAIAALTHEINFTYFDIREYEKPLLNKNPKDDNLLIILFKLLAPEHLLKLPFANDSNSLDKGFYTELLHIIGLTETKEGGKKLITRKEKGQRNAGSLIESAIVQLDSTDKLSRLDKPSQFGTTTDERLFNVALELSITWINRILFLKLLEAQLIKYHKGDKSYAFLNTERVKGYDDMNTLFFQVLAKKADERNDKVRELFANVPYLNSSLFEATDIEHTCFFISQLEDEKIPLLSNTVIKDQTGKKRTGELLAVEYIFEFLNAYDFSSEGGEEIQEDNKRLINASVLGLIFEKINGYKDGSFFTPGFITMYMCRETIRRAVLQKFNEQKGWDCTDLHQLYDRIDDRPEANTIINSLKICDPAVGSGHFLVSALNEIIAIKSELRILSDREGKRLKEYNVVVENDELIVTDDDGLLFEYNPLSKESQRVQETLFHEKQTIIENCLFGVDLNPNSVKICRLRLWIELLKNAYYRSASEGVTQSHPLTNTRELETLPNIDINIKCGNSLISRFALDADLKQALKNSKYSIVSYRSAVDLYRNARNKEQKREMEKLIASIKSDFKSNIDHPFKKTISAARGKVDVLATQINTKKQWGEKVDKKALVEFEKAVQKLKKLEDERDDIEANKIYENAFEWRFEFPEVLNDEGDFVGFDVVIGNPPYINANDFKKIVGNTEYNYYKENYTTAKGTVDVYIYFFELGFKILKQKQFFCFITPNRYLSANYGVALRKLLIDNYRFIEIGDYSSVKVFAEASTYPILSLFQKAKTESAYIFNSFTFIDEFSTPNYRTFDSVFLEYFNDNILGFILSSKFDISKKVIDQSVSLNSAGIINATSTAGEAETFHEYISSEEVGFKLINTGTIDRYSTTWGIDKLTDKGEKYLRPFLPRDIDKLGKNRMNLYSSPKIVFAKIAIRTEAFFDENGIYASINTNCIHSFRDEYNPYYVLGWLNSKLFQYVFECFFDGLKMSGGYLLYSAPNMINMYIKNAEKSIQNAIADKVKTITSHKTLNSTANTSTLESEIDQLVYELYGLTEEEIKIVEGEK